jgi:hypothetical protein
MTRFPRLIGIITPHGSLGMLGDEQVNRRILMITLALFVITFYVVAMVLVFGGVRQ